MKVVDAGVVVKLFAGSLDPDQLGDEELASPYLIDSEVTHALRGLVARRVLTPLQGTRVLDGFARLTLTRFSAESIRDRMWELRENLSAYDASYVAFAKATDATALLTTDARFGRASGPRCRIDLL